MFNFLDNDTLYDVRLDCDPAYGTDNPLTVFSVRPQTKEIINAATLAAGPVPYAGRLLLHRTAEAVTAAGTAKILTLQPDLKGAAFYTAYSQLTDADKEAVGYAHLVAEAAELNKMTDQERQFVDAAKEWAATQQEALACGVVAKVNGEAVEDFGRMLRSMSPATARAALVSELCEVTKRMASLDPKACSSYAEQCGCAMTPDAEAGSATTA